MTFVRALHPLRCDGKFHHTGDCFETEEHTAFGLRRGRHAVIIEAASGEWARPDGHDLHSIQPAPGQWHRVVACLNIWNDRAAIERTLPTWYEHVDAVLAVDGAYTTTPSASADPRSDDGTREFLAGFDKVTILDPPMRASQNEKRNLYLAHAEPGDLCFIVDADESVTHAEALRRTPDLDVGWVRCASPLYERSYWQPRLVRAMPDLVYRGRHHWIWRGPELFTTHQYGGLALHARVPIEIWNQRGLGHSAVRAAQKRAHLFVQHGREAPRVAVRASAASDGASAGREALRILHVTQYDAGLAVSRLHSALNTSTPHTSLYFRDAGGGPFGAREQYIFERDREKFEGALPGADIVHAHLTGRLVLKYRHLAKRVVIHHHGSMFRKAPGYHEALARALHARTFVSNLELLSYDPAAVFLPNPVPVARYRSLRVATWTPHRAFRIAHSPSKRELKGTEIFLEAIARLQRKGRKVEAVLIEGQSHAEALRVKATCDAAFDSFWLGIQCAGLEAGAMGMPVVAGDLEVAGRYRERWGDVPYTFADADTLAGVLDQLAHDPAFYEAEALRVRRYVERMHDTAAVALRYLDALDEWFYWRTGWRAPKGPARHLPREPIETPEHEPVRTPAREPIQTPATEPLEIR